MLAEFFITLNQNHNLPPPKKEDISIPAVILMIWIKRLQVSKEASKESVSKTSNADRLLTLTSLATLTVVRVLMNKIKWHQFRPQDNELNFIYFVIGWHLKMAQLLHYPMNWRQQRVTTGRIHNLDGLLRACSDHHFKWHSIKHPPRNGLF